MEGRQLVPIAVSIHCEKKKHVHEVEFGVVFRSGSCSFVGLSSSCASSGSRVPST